MDKLIEALSNDRLMMKKLARAYITHGDLRYVELDFGFDSGSIEQLFDDNPDFAIEFDETLQALKVNRLRREGSHKIFKVLKALYDVVDDDTDVAEGGPSISDKVRAANTIVKIVEITDKSKKGDKDSGDIDDILREIEGELQQR